MLTSNYLNSSFDAIDHKDKTTMKILRSKEGTSPLSLITDDGEVLAIVEFRAVATYRNSTQFLYPKVKTSGRTFITPCNPPGLNEPRFQGIINMEDQTWELVVANLSKVSYIGFDIMKPNGKSLSAINVIQPGQTCIVKSDQETNRELILSALKNSSGMDVSVREDDESVASGNSRKGIMYQIKLFPDEKNSFKQLEMFHKASWHSSNIICLKQKVNPWFKSFPVELASGDVNPQSSFSSSADTSSSSPNPHGFSFGSTNSAFSPQSKSFSFGTIVDGPVLDDVPKSMDYGDLCESTAGIVTEGKSHFVETVDADIDIEYQFASPVCKLSLSIMKNLVFVPKASNESIVKESMDLIQRIKTEKVSAYLNKISTIFHGDSCCICLEKHPDTVLYACGHKCIHSSCIDPKITTCPLCRTHVTAFIDTNKKNIL